MSILCRFCIYVIISCLNNSSSPVYLDELIQYTSLVWLHEFIQLAGTQLLPFTSGILAAILPCYSYDDELHKNIIDAARNVNMNLMKLISSKAKGMNPSHLFNKYLKKKTF